MFPAKFLFILAKRFQMRRIKCDKLTDGGRQITVATWWQKVTWPLVRRAKKIINQICPSINDRLYISLNYSEFSDHIDHIYSTDIEIVISTSYIELHDRFRNKLFEKISVFPLCTFHLYVAAFQQHKNEYIWCRSLCYLSALPWSS